MSKFRVFLMGSKSDLSERPVFTGDLWGCMEFAEKILEKYRGRGTAKKRVYITRIEIWSIKTAATIESYDMEVVREHRNKGSKALLHHRQKDKKIQFSME